MNFVDKLYHRIGKLIRVKQSFNQILEKIMKKSKQRTRETYLKTLEDIFADSISFISFNLQSFLFVYCDLDSKLS